MNVTQRLQSLSSPSTHLCTSENGAKHQERDPVPQTDVEIKSPLGLLVAKTNPNLLSGSCYRVFYFLYFDSTIPVSK